MGQGGMHDVSRKMRALTKSKCEIEQARLLTLSAADKIDRFGIKEAKDLITKLLITDPDKRITAEEIRCHPWIDGTYKASKKNLNTLEAMKGWNSKRKLPMQ